MRVFTAPTTYPMAQRPAAMFLAGGISGCPDWQASMIPMLADTGLDLLNPRRPDFPMHDPIVGTAQIHWEWAHLHRARAILFWFPEETLCPIALYELGAWSMTDRTLFVGVHPGYQRRHDVQIQTGLARPDVTVVHSLDQLAAQVRAWAP